MKWTRARIEKQLWSVAKERGEIFQAQCIHHAENIDKVLTHLKMHAEIDFKKIIDGTFWEALNKYRLQPYNDRLLGKNWDACLPLGTTFEEWLRLIHEDFSRGIFRDDLKFKAQKYSKNKKYISVKEAALILKLSPRQVENLCSAGKLLWKFKYKFRVEIKTGRKIKPRIKEVLLGSLKEYKKAKK